MKKSKVQDKDAYLMFKHHRKWFNKLWLSETLGYECGPCGIAPPRSNYYIVRPVMNLQGMSLSARKQYIHKGDNSVVKPGEFWCEWFEGIQYSVDFKVHRGRWKQQSCYRADRDVMNLTMFKKWSRYEHKMFKLDSMFDSLLDVKTINVEFIDDRPIEVHLRSSSDPKYDELIPIWKDSDEQTIDIYSKMGYSYIESYDDCDGLLKNSRVGFMVK